MSYRYPQGSPREPDSSPLAAYRRRQAEKAAAEAESAAHAQDEMGKHSPDCGCHEATRERKHAEASPDGLSAARACAQWHLGDPDWADSIINAYLNPEAARELLHEEMGEDA